MFLTLSLTLFNIVLSFGHLFVDFFNVYKGFPFAALAINFNLVLLMGLLLFLYRRWKSSVAEQKRDQEALLALRSAVENMQIGVTIADVRGKILYVNPAEAEMHGYRVEDLQGKDSRMLGPAEIWRPMLQPVIRRFRRETTNVRKDGSGFPVQLMTDVVTNSHGDIIAFVTTCEDITERKKNEEMIRQLAFYDALSSLPNRALFNDRLGQELAKARRHNGLLAILFIDLDRFKIINDTLGHAVGDLLLKAVARRLKGMIREGDTLCRLGGDEFIMLFTDIDSLSVVSVVAKKIQENLAEVFILNDIEVYITSSIGISIFPDDGDSMEILVKNADAAMYYAKEQGRNNFQFYNATINAVAIEKIKMQGNLRGALQQNEFTVYYQPQVDLRTGRIVGAEALARWQHPELGVLSPEKFISLAEEIGIISSIGEFLLFTACAQTKAWQEAGFPHIRIAVNISTYQFVQKGFIEMLKKSLDEIGLEPKYLELEFTESIVMQNSDFVKSTLKELKALGIQCSIDDFGTGYSSLNYLKYLPINRLKLDRSFVSSLAMNQNDDAISKAIITLAHDLNLQVTAEGVETTEQLEFLRYHDCDEAQGFLFAKPLPAKDFVKLLLEEEMGDGRRFPLSVRQLAV